MFVKHNHSGIVGYHRIVLTLVNHNLSMNIKIYLNLVLIITTLLISGAFSLSNTTPATADHGRSISECEEFYLGNDGMDLCIDHARIDTQYENCQQIPDVREADECINEITPATDGYYGKKPKADSGGAGSGSEFNESTLTPEEQAALDSLTDFNQGGQYDCDDVSTSINVECEAGVNPIISYITAIVNFISAGVGIAIIANVMIGGVQYMMAGGNPQATQAAIQRITNAFIALFAFIFMWAFFNWLIPGGIL